MKDSALQRRIKKEIYAQPQRLRLEPAPGWDAVLQAEAERLVGDWSLPSKFTASCEVDATGIWLTSIDFRNVLEVPLRLLTAADVLWSLLSRHVGSFGELQHCLTQLPWELYLPAGAALRIKAVSYRSKLFHEGKIEEMVNAHLSSLGYRVDGDEGSIRIVCEQIENRHTIFVSLAGEALFHRHYKVSRQHAAPLQEHLAAAALQWFSAWPGEPWHPDLIYIPFAGSGTFYCESMLQYGAVPAFRWRQPHYTIAQLACLPEASWRQIIQRLEARKPALEPPPALLVEKDPATFQTLQQNIDHFRAGAGQPLQLAPPLLLQADALQQSLPETATRIFLPLNPPYGLRLDQGSEGSRYYQKLGQWLARFQGRDLRGFILVPDPESLKAFQSALPTSAVQAVQSFTQGGQHIRCVAFSLQAATPPQA